LRPRVAHNMHIIKTAFHFSADRLIATHARPSGQATQREEVTNSGTRAKCAGCRKGARDERLPAFPTKPVVKSACGGRPRHEQPSAGKSACATPTEKPQELRMSGQAG
jgi:hypothetical protein